MSRPRSCSAAMHTRTGPLALAIRALYSSDSSSRPEFKMASDITCHSVWTSRTCSTSSIQREVIQAQGHSGSNQKSQPVMGTVTVPRVHGIPPSTRRMAPVVKDDASLAK